MNINTLSAITFTIDQPRSPLTGELSHYAGGRHTITFYNVTPWCRAVDQDITMARMVTHCPRCGVFIQAPMLMTGLEELEITGEKMIEFVTRVLDNARESTTEAYRIRVCGPTPTYRRKMARLARVMRRKRSK